VGKESNEHKQEVVIESAVDIRESWPPVRAILRVLIVISIVGAVVWILYKLTAILFLIVLSIFFAYLVSPLVEVLRRPLNIAKRRIVLPRVAAIAVAYLMIFTGVLATFYFIVPQLVNQFPQFSAQAQSYARIINDKTLQFNEYLTLRRIPAAMVNALNKASQFALDEIGASASLVITSIAAWAIYIPWLVLIPILSFFFLKDAESFRRSALLMLPRGRWRWRGDEFFQDVNSTLAAYIRAQLTASVFIGAVCAGGFAVFRLPSPLVLGLLAGMFEFVPILGPLLIAILAALIAVFHSGFSSALLILVFLAVLRTAQDYFIYPRLIGHGIHLHPLGIILAILCGEKLAGVAGVFLAIPVVAVITVSYRHWMEHRGSEGLADLLEADNSNDSQTNAATVVTIPPVVVLPPDDKHDFRQHPTSRTTPDEMARKRPDLTTGELTLPEEEME